MLNCFDIFDASKTCLNVEETLVFLLSVWRSFSRGNKSAVAETWRTQVPASISRPRQHTPDMVTDILKYILLFFQFLAKICENTVYATMLPWVGSFPERTGLLLQSARSARSHSDSERAPAKCQGVKYFQRVPEANPAKCEAFRRQKMQKVFLEKSKCLRALVRLERNDKTNIASGPLSLGACIELGHPVPAIQGMKRFTVSLLHLLFRSSTKQAPECSRLPQNTNQNTRKCLLHGEAQKLNKSLEDYSTWTRILEICYGSVRRNACWWCLR